MKKQSVVFSTIIVFVSLTAITLAALYLSMFSPITEKQAKRSLYEKIKTTSDLCKPQIEKALKSQDDLTLLAQIDTMSKIEDVSFVYVLDSSGKVVTHNKTAEWGKVYTDATNKRALTSTDGTVVKYAPAKGYLYSSPLVSSMTLCIGISAERMNLGLQTLQKKYFAASAAILFVFALISWLFVTLKFRNSFKSIEKMLKAIIAGTSDKIDIKTNDEFALLATLINDALAARNNAPKTNNSLKTDLQTLADNLSNSYLCINQDNIVVTVSAKFLKEFSVNKEDLLDKHIIDISVLPFITDMVKRTSSQEIVKETIAGKEITAIKDKNTSGILITAE